MAQGATQPSQHALSPFSHRYFVNVYLQVSWDSAYAARTENSDGSAAPSASDSNDASLRQNTSQLSDASPAAVTDVMSEQMVAMDTQTCGSTPTAAPVPESRTMNPADFARRKAGESPCCSSLLFTTFDNSSL